MTEQKNSLIDDLHCMKMHWGEEENYYLAEQIIDDAIKALEEIQQYREIGTVEECREAVEKQKEKKPIIKYKQTQDCVTEVEWKCPTCEANYIELAPCGEWCRYCGTKLDWGEE